MGFLFSFLLLFCFFFLEFCGKVTTAQVVKTSVTVNNNSAIQDCVHADNQTQPTFEYLFKLVNPQMFVCPA